jgi:hypothetical protein
MSKHRPEAILDIYKLVLGLVLFVSPWLFAFAGGAAAMDACADGAAIAVVSQERTSSTAGTSNWPRDAASLRWRRGRFRTHRQSL